ILHLETQESSDRQTRELIVVACRYVYKSEKVYVIQEDPDAEVNAFQTLSRIAEDEKANTSRNFRGKAKWQKPGQATFKLSHQIRLTYDKVRRPRI
ncbi:hypothetical protein QYM36_002934, partial [Artemia franciscana]